MSISDKRASLIIDLLAGHDRHALDQRLGLGAAMGFDHADHDVDAGLLPRRAFGQHLVGLADAGSRAEEDLQTAAALLRGFAKEGLRRRSVGIGVHFADFALKPSSCRLSARTLTCASPMKPSVGPVDRTLD